MHNIFTTEGIVLGKRTQGEANTRIALLTEDFGMVRASARSARLERSKLRYGLETLTSGRFAMVRGKYEWKLTGAEELSHSYIGQSLGSRRVAGRVARLLLRLMPGEEPGKELYTVVRDGLSYVARAPADELEQAECLLVLRLLSGLGYVERGQKVQALLDEREFSPGVMEQAKRLRPLLIATINESLSATGL